MEKEFEKSENEWRKELTPEQFHVCRQGGTEAPFTGKYNEFKGIGIFVCSCCGNPLFDSKTKFNSGTGWPSFYDAVDKSAIKEIEDNSLGMKRVEIKCSKCDAHLGHVFPDGPNPTGMRYCVNSLSLDFDKDDE